MPGDGYDRDREPCDNNARGRIWENGTDRYYRDRESGYVKPSREQELPTTSGVDRRYDKQRGDARTGPVRAIEDKSGEIGGRKDESQLRRDYGLIRDGKVEHLLLRSVAGERISPVAQQLIKDLQRDFPDKFTHQIISRQDAREIWARGLQRETGKQLELPGVGEQARQQKAQQRDARQQEKAREERARVEREGTQRVVREFPSPEQARTRDDNRDKATPAVTRERTDPLPKTKDVREREQAQAREMVDNLGHNLINARNEQLQAILRESREDKRKDVAREIEPTRNQQPPAPPAAPQRTFEQERENARALAREAGLSPQIMGILGLNTNDPRKMIDVGQARTQADAERDRSIHQKRERSEREREGRRRGD